MKKTLRINGREGSRVGFKCLNCDTTSNIKEQGLYFLFEYGSQFARTICRKCGSDSIVSIWDKEYEPKILPCQGRDDKEEWEPSLENCRNCKPRFQCEIYRFLFT